MTAPPVNPPPHRSGPATPPASPPPAPPRARKSPATAHLCAAAHLDHGFRRRVIEEVYRRTDRAIAPNPGADAVPILNHALRARALDAARQAVFTGLLLLLLFAPVVNKFGLVLGLASLSLLGLPVRALDARKAYMRQGSGLAAAKRLASPLAVMAAVVIVLYLLLPLTPIRIDHGHLVHEPTGHSLAYACAFNPDGGYAECVSFSSEYGFEPGTGLVVFWLLVLGLVAAVFGATRGRRIASIPYEPEPARPVDERVGFIGRSQWAPVVVYSAAGLPFVGSGRTLTTWQFAMALRPADADRPMRIDPVALNGHVKARMQRLAADSPTTSRLPNLVLKDHVYVSGRDTTAPVRFPEELPQAGYGFQTLEQVQVDPTTPVRHYLRCEVSSWGGELVTTVFIHCALQGESMYVEFTGCMLPPTPERYHVFGRGASRRRILWTEVLRGLASMPAAFARSPFDSVANLVRAVKRARLRRDFRTRAAEDHGAVTGIREFGTEGEKRNYFQQRDSIKYAAILERQILDALTEHLRESNVDTAEIDERMTAIINNGVINNGNLVAGAAGAGATATVGAMGKGSQGTVTGGTP